MRIIFALLFAVVLAGCYSREARTQERLDAKVDAFAAANGREPNAEEMAVLRTAAENEERAARRGELEAAGKDALAAGGAAVSGNLIGAGLLGIGALLTLLGLNRGKKALLPDASTVASAAIAEVKKES